MGPQTHKLVEASVERAIAVAARNSDVCAGTGAKTHCKPRVFAVSKQARLAVLDYQMAYQNVPLDPPHPLLLLHSSGEETAVGNQKKV